ncbi:uncharacterized protein LOC124408688 [Diprion similis]|uniref:uncharacterized protein LOC124408688 n=1 Tax=Diprion similis TaxID=362088 RepID=UPI001EF793CE|nr:uncharacterized protein LOC124408688 [Diprion similis]
MKILTTLMYIFAVGTVTSSMAQTRSEIDLRTFLPSFASRLRLRLKDDSFFKDESARQAARERCEKHGGPFAFSNATAALEDFRNSLELIANDTIKSARLNFLQPLNDRDEFAKICSFSQTTNTLVNLLLESSKPCLTQKEQHSAGTLVNMTISTTNYICKNNGSRLLSFWRDHGVECAMKKSRAMENCNRVARPVHIPSDNHTAVDRFNLPWIVPSSYNVEICRRIDSFFTCVLEQLQSCEQPTTYKVASDFVNHYEETIGCKNLPKAKTSATA